MTQLEQENTTRRRVVGEGNVYHLTTRGVAQQIIFEDDKDRQRMIDILIASSEKQDVDLLTWCFMDNHIHLIVHAELDEIARFMNGALSSYARVFNKRHCRSGHLFQARFHSVPVCSNEQLMTAVRYVHLNPATAGVSDVESYRWSSYSEFVTHPRTIKASFVLDVFGGIGPFIEFHRQPNDDQDKLASKFEGENNNRSSGEDDAIIQAKQLLGIDELAAINEMPKEERDKALVLLKKIFGIRRTARITGIGRNIVQRAK